MAYVEITSKIKKIISELLPNIEELDPDDNLLMKGLDSLSAIKLIVALEQEFGIDFDDEELVVEEFLTIKGIQEKVLSKIQS